MGQGIGDWPLASCLCEHCWKHVERVTAAQRIWIKESPNDGIRAVYAMRMAELDPYDTIRQVLLMTDALGREKVAVHVAKKIYKQNPESIRDWLPQIGLSEASQQRILRNQ